jgi:hypothetical protein
MYVLLGKPQSILQARIGAVPFDARIRNKIPIAIIDDETFAYEKLLRDHSYNIKHFGDIQDIRSLEVYPVILCDIKGVGKAFASKFEGGHLIKEIRSFYPYKVIYAYSGHQVDPSFNKYFQMADKTLKKDISLEDWVSNLDEALRMITDPCFLWKRMRKRLLQEDIPICDIMKLEDQFVSFIKEKKNEFPDKKYSTNLPDKATTLLSGFSETLQLLRSIV